MFKTKKVLTITFKTAITIIPLIWVFYRIDYHAFKIAFSKVAVWTIPSVVVLFLFAMILQGIRWWVLLKAYLPELSLNKTLSAHFKGMLYSIVFPAAQDIFRAALLAKENDYMVIWGATWISKLQALIVSALLAISGLVLIDTSFLPSNIFFVLIGVGFLLCLLILLSFTKKITRHFRPVFKKVIPFSIYTHIEKIREGVYLYRKRKQSLIVAFSITLVMLCAGIFNSSLIIKGITGNFYFIEVLFFIPTIEIIILFLPITPNGIGLREALLPLFLITYLHFTPEQFGIYVLMGLLGTVLRIVGIVPVIADLFNQNRVTIFKSNKNR